MAPDLLNPPLSRGERAVADLIAGLLWAGALVLSVQLVAWSAGPAISP